MTRNVWASIGAIIVVGAAITLGFWNLGTPARERQVHQDVRTVQALQALGVNATTTWRANKTMPANLESLAPAEETKDPTTHLLFTYHRKEGAAYELCATFLTDNRNDTESQAPFWRHGKGLYCFELDASHNPPPGPFFNF